MPLGCDLFGGVAPSTLGQPGQTSSAAAAEPSGTSSQPVAMSYCPEAILFDPPVGLAESDRVTVPAGSDPAGLRVTWSDSSSREFSILSGLEGEVGGPEILAPMNVRGHVATVSANRGTDTFVAVWREAPQDSPCSQYAAIGTGFSESEFRTHVENIR